MFKIKRTPIILICLSLALLSGCRQNDKKPIPVFSAGIPVSSAVQGSSSVIGSSAQSTSDQATSEEPAEQSSEPPVSSSVPAVIEPPVIYPQTVVYNHDPNNSCAITFDGKSITVTGIYGDLFDDVDDIYPTMNITRSLNNGILTCVMTPQHTDFDRNFGSFAILDKEHNSNKVFVDLSYGTVMFPDMSGLVSGNNRTVSSVITASDAKTAQYITMDGNRDGVPRILNEIQALSDEICEGIDDDYEKLRAIARWVSDNIFYDHPIYNRGAPQYCLSLEYMLKNRASICGGYSNITSALCAAQGIRCLNITGMAVNNGKCFLQDAVGEYHEWNIAEIDGRQIIVDTGWNSGNSINSNKSLSVNPPRYKYFDISEEVFALDHKAQTAEYRDYWALV